MFRKLVILSCFILTIVASTPAHAVDRDEARRLYLKAYKPALSQSIGWTGSVDKCQAGTFSNDALTAMEKQVNAARKIAGLSSVDLAKSDAAQRTALMMDANDELSHYPSLTWKCYTLTGANMAARANLAISYRHVAGAALDLYLDDPGTTNTVVGHRRWIFLPEARQYNIGQTSEANAWQTIGIPTAFTYRDPRWVSWPSRGAFPSELEPQGRWSLSAKSNDYRWREPRVHVWHKGARLSDPKVYTPAYGYGRPTLVWAMPKTVTRGAYRVQVVNNGSVVRDYTTRIFNADN